MRPDPRHIYLVFFCIQLTCQAKQVAKLNLALFFQPLKKFQVLPTCANIIHLEILDAGSIRDQIKALTNNLQSIVPSKMLIVEVAEHVHGIKAHTSTSGLPFMTSLQTAACPLRNGDLSLRLPATSFPRHRRLFFASENIQFIPSRRLLPSA